VRLFYGLKLPVGRTGKYYLSTIFVFNLCAGVIPAAAQTQAAAQIMSVPGQSGVGATGNASYTIPIVVPPGTAGMVPSLSLVYHSQAGNGLLGVGWALEGLPSIGRCPRTVAQDGVSFSGSINYDANDRFCLDGQRLIAISGIDGNNGTEYRTEIETFSKVVSFGTAGTGPAWFEVRTKSGQIMEFGNSADSRILAQGKTTARSWTLNKVSDTKGNYFTVTYTNDTVNGQAYPTRIDYTGNSTAGLAPYNSVRFVYGSARPDVTPRYQAGSLQKVTVRLTNVQTFSANAMVADYRLAYEQSVITGRSRISSVSLCDGSGSCLPATTIGWQNSTITPTINSNAGGQDGTLAGYMPYVGDFNGDGRADILWDLRLAADTGSRGTRVLWTSSGAGTFSVNSNFAGMNGAFTSATTQDCNATRRYFAILGDFNRDGRTDLLWTDWACTSPTFSTTFWLSTNSGTYDIRPGPTGNSSRFRFLLVGQLLELYAPVFGAAGDLNNDGRMDFSYLQTSTFNSTVEFTIGKSWLVNGDGSVTVIDSTPPTNAGGFSGVRDQTKTGGSGSDFNGDGIIDSLAFVTQGKGFQFLMFGNGDGTSRVVAGVDTSVNDYAPTLVDINGDGNADILWGRIDANGRSLGQRILWISKGDGTFDKQLNAGGQDGQLVGYVPYTADFNGDGFGDILWDQVDTLGRSAGTRVLWVGKGDGTFTVIPNFAGQNGQLAGFVPMIADYNGDGKVDILWDSRSTNDGRSTGTRVFWLSDGVAADLVTSITTGIGTNVAFTYQSLVSNVYTKDSTAIDPVTDLQGPFQVVSRVDISNGIGGTSSDTYAYAGAKVDLNGRGFLSFREMTTTDLETNVSQITTYRQDYPFTGMVATEITKIGAQILKQINNSYLATALGGTRRQVFVSQSQVQAFDLDGSVMPVTTSSYLYDAFGNTTSISVTSSDGFSKTTTNTYSNDAANWILGRLTSASVTSQTPP
jgi:hypothetical protein